MTVITDYESLKTRIIEMLDRNDLVDHVESFIQMAEDDISSDVQHPRGLDMVVFTAQSQVALPIDFRRVISMSGVGVAPLEFCSTEDFFSLTEQGQGGYIYTIVGENFYFAPYIVESQIRLIYNRRLDGLSYYNPTNWVLDNWPSAYLYAALKAAAIYLVEDERIPVWTAMYGDIIDRINKNAVDYRAPEFTSLLKRKIV